MIPPRRASTAADPALLVGVLGAAAMLGQLCAIVKELAADGDRGDGEPPDDEVVDVVLGLAALADAVAHRLPDDPGAPCTSEDAAAREPGELVVGELLR